MWMLWKRGGANSGLCTECDKWCLKRCSDLRNLRRVQNFVCPRCGREGEGDDDRDNEGPRLVVNRGILKEVRQFCWTVNQEWREQCERE